MTDLTLGEYIASPEYPLPAGSAPARFAQLLGEVAPEWRIEPPEEGAADLHFSAIAPDGPRRVVAITADWPPADGYRDIDEWQITGYGPHRVETVMQLCHDAGRPEFDVVLRLLRAAWAE